jgi:cytochrome P450
MPSRRPELDVDLFTDDAVRDPFLLYQAIRDCAPAVWLPAHGVWALGRFQHVRAALRADDVLVSGRGVALNDFLNAHPARTTLSSDGELHRTRRSVMMKPMMPSALADVRAKIERLAGDLVASLRARDSFDGIADFARHLPVAVVSHLVGLPEEGRERMLAWGAATFNVLGPLNDRATAAVPDLIGMTTYASGAERTALRPDGWAARLFVAAENGKIAVEDVPGLLIDYIAPSLDTTILGTGHLLFLLGRHPKQYDRVRADPALIPATVSEALRIGSPVRAFTRFAIARYEDDGVVIPEGDRVLVLYGAANRDERRYADPDRFDVTRDARDHLAFGHGVHRCAGGYLAELEMEALLRALVAQVERIEVSEPRPLMNNMLHGHESFRVTLR